MAIYRPLSVNESFNIESKQPNELRQIPIFPKLECMAKLGDRLPSNGAQLRALYNTSLRCAVVTSVFGPVRVGLYKQSPLSLNQTEASHIETVPDNRLFSAVFDAIRRPPCITAAALDYVQKTLEHRKYIGVHWRYNKRDWLGQCDKKSTPKRRQEVCNNIRSIKPVHVAEAIISEMQKILNIGSVTETIIPIYIAVPPSLNAFKEGIYEELSRLNFSKAIKKPATNLTSFLRANYQQCWEDAGWKIFDEIESFCEMEIMVHSTWFFYSDISSWSSNIRPWRTQSLNSTKRKFESAIYSATVEVKRKT